VSVRFDPGTYFSIVRQNESGLDWMPVFHIGRFQRNSHSLPDTNMIEWTAKIEPLKSLFSTLDFNSMKSVLIVTPTSLLPEPNTLWQVCGERETKENLKIYNIFYVRSLAGQP